ncbi:putative phosphatase regulatory subunit-domain-containing protein [Rhodocollybia butyracea]|uniref:Phosphatase regulatory subunit-domain-containing protein n=1 Tax=Rhodocollybia butyracea TaxID=206335 RepID=A0A9P5TZW6_9AGAR|nr:putative phosphatase regulatory subunit-domain-containing protein [Rhodocollybia butyracea]
MTVSSLSSNTAGSPLPRIPRRASSTLRSYAPGISSPPKATPSPVKITVQQATPPEHPSTSGNGSDSSSSSSISSGRLSLPRAKSRRLKSTEPMSPTLSIPRSKKEPKREVAKDLSSSRHTAPLTLALDDLPSRTQSDLLVEFPSIEPEVTRKSAPVAPLLIVRKKSGQLVKPSLKYSRSAFKSLTVTPGGSASKSEPATPTVPKAVKFDSRLEHVKLFLAEQRPLAVSRDGSPTDDTSGTESDFPSFIFGKSKALKMTLANMPPSLNLNTDIVLEEMKLSLDGLSIVGRIRVRNVSFQKWVAVRFTFDDWQTTSEVTAKYIESTSPEFDVFGFTIRLTDLIARIEEKTLIVALRYNVDGREIWDNNFGRNYVVKFSKEAVKPAEQSRVSAIGTERDISSGIFDLHNRLEKVVMTRDDEGTAMTPARAQSTVTSPEVKSVFKTDTTLSNRYDFGTSFRTAFKPATRDHTRMHSHPVITSSSLDSIQWPEVPRKRRSVPKEKPTLGSPRDLEDAFRPTPFVPSDEDGSDSPVSRNHQRGYFDLTLMDSSNVKMPPPGTPRSRSFDDITPLASPRFHSYPSIRPGSGYHLPGLGFALSPKDAVLAEASLISPPRSNASMPIEAFPFSMSPVESSSPKTNYNQFLNRFCFFTGSESGHSSDECPSESLSRSSSTSSVDDFLCSSPYDLGVRSLSLFSPEPVTRTRDDISLRLGSGPFPQPESESRSVTPIAR